MPVYDGLYSGGHPSMLMQNFGGTPSNPLPTPANRWLGTVTYSGYNGSQSVQIGRIAVISSGEFSVGNHPAKMYFNIGGSATCCGATRMLIDGVTGNVGIGKTSPDYKLDVNGDVHVGKKLRIFRQGISATTFYLESVSNNSSINVNSSSDYLTFNVGSGAPERMRITNSGNVGIGTITPSAKLDIEGGNFYLGEEVNANGQRRQLRVYGYDSNSQFYGSIHSNWEDGKRTFDIYTSNTTHQLKIDVSANTNGRIAILPGQSAGVGIGTLVTGSHKLAVEGSIGARSVKVEANGWSDFGFEDDYKLSDLKDVEKYISENNHLPEIPSEAEVKENGINLGEMDAKLLQKIEELTLYLIEQNKQLESQSALLSAQQQRIDLLEKRISQ